MCDALWLKIEAAADGLNWYDLYRPDYDTLGVAKQAELRANRFGETTINGEIKKYKRGYTMQEYTPWVKHL